MKMTVKDHFDVIPAKAGIQPRTGLSWTPAPDQVDGKLCAGVT